MAQVLVRQLNEQVVERLKKRAKEHGRSLQSEVKTILEEAVPDYEGAWLRIEGFRSRLKNPVENSVTARGLFVRIVIGESIRR